MTTQAEKYRSILRYSYGLAGVVFGGAAVVIIALFLIMRSESEARNRIASFHLKSTTYTQELINAVDTVIDHVREPVAPPSDASRRSTSVQLGSDVSGIMQLISERVALLQELQEDFGGPEFEKTLARVASQLDLIRDSDSLNSEQAQETLFALSVSLRHFYRLHVIAVNDVLGNIDGVTTGQVPFLGILAIIIAVSALGLWIIVRALRALRATVARQITAEQALFESEKRMYHMQKLEALGQLVGGVAHDFNNLLTVILGQTGLLLDRAGDDARLRTGLAETREAARQAASLTNQLLMFGRRQLVAPIAFDLNELIKDIEPMLRRTIGEQIQLSVNCADELGEVELDPGQMQQVILNLVVNARDAMPQGGRLSITTRNVNVGPADTDADGLPVGSFVRLTVSDSGVGMDKLTRTRLFEPFYTTKPKGYGTGLGLSTVHGIVTSANGRILVDSYSGTGSRFDIYLPRSKRTAGSQDVATCEEKGISGAETVLIVEDEEQIRAFLEKGLTTLGYRVLVAGDADMGLEICGNPGNIDVIVSDVIMPKTNGAEFLEKALQLQPHAAGIFMSGYTDDVVLQSGVDGSEIPLINKPFEIDQLATLIRRRIEGDAGLSP